MKIFLWCSPHLDLLIIWIHQTKSCYVGSGIFKILQIHQMKILNMMLYFLFDNMSTERRLIGNSDGWRLMEWIFLANLFPMYANVVQSKYVWKVTTKQNTKRIEEIECKTHQISDQIVMISRHKTHWLSFLQYWWNLKRMHYYYCSLTLAFLISSSSSCAHLVKVTIQHKMYLTSLLDFFQNFPGNKT